MKRLVLPSLIISLSMVVLLSCGQNNTNFQSKHVVKVVKIRTYEAKTEFDKLVIGQRSMAFLPDNEEQGAWLDWTNFYYDSFGNVLCKEYVGLDEAGNEFVRERTIYEYHSPKENKLSLVKNYSNCNTPKFAHLAETRYKRNSKGLITDVENYEDEKLTEKSVMSYNEHDQRIKVEVYTPKGLMETSVFGYESSYSTDYSSLVTTSEIDYSIVEETEERLLGVKMSKRFKLTERGKLVSDLTTTYEWQRPNVLKSETIKGVSNYSMFEPENEANGKKAENESYRIEISKAMNERGDIERIVITKKGISSADKVDTDEWDWLWKSNGNSESIRTYSYTYGAEGEWTKCIHTDGFGAKYILTRDVKVISNH